MSNVIKANLGITRSSDGNYYIRIGCESSRTSFCELKLTGQQFAEAITGLHTSDYECTVHGLDRVGKTRVREARQALCPLSVFSQKEQEQWLLDNCQEDGWILDNYLRKQNAVKTLSGARELKYSVYKFVDVGEDDAITD